MSTSISCLESVVDELHVDQKTGEGFVSWRGLARMSGQKSHGNFNMGRTDLGKERRIFSLKIDEYLTELGFNLANFDYSRGVPDLLAAEVIAYYAEELGNQTAKQSSRGFRAIGLRQAIHIATGWKAKDPNKLSDSAHKRLNYLRGQGKPSQWIDEKGKGILLHNKTKDALIEHNCTAPKHHAMINNALVQNTIGLPKDIRKQRGLKPTANSTEAYSSSELAVRTFTHIQYLNRLDNTNPRCFKECHASAIATAQIVENAMRLIANGSVLTLAPAE